MLNDFNLIKINRNSLSRRKGNLVGIFFFVTSTVSNLYTRTT